MLDDFHKDFAALDLSRAANVNLFTMFYRLTYAGRLLVARHRGIYRATAELGQNDFTGFGPLQTIAPAVERAVSEVIPDYADQLPEAPGLAQIAHTVQPVTMSVLQTELGMGPLYPSDIEMFSSVIARAACGVLGTAGQTAHPSVTIHDGGF